MSRNGSKLNLGVFQKAFQEVIQHDTHCCSNAKFAVEKILIKCISLVGFVVNADPILLQSPKLDLYIKSFFLSGAGAQLTGTSLELR